MRSIIKHLEAYDHIIWDWNGTLLNDRHVAVKAVNQVLAELELPKITQEQYLKSFRFPVQDYYKDLGIEDTKHDFDRVSKQFHKHYGAFLEEAQLFEGTENLLTQLSSTKHLSVLSAAAQWLLDKWVDDYNVKNHFSLVYGIDNLNAHSKVYRGKELIKESPNDMRTIMIGDTAHDFEVATEMGIDTLIIAQGHQCYEKLKELPCMVVEKRL